MSAHTPGPWIVKATPESSNQNFIVQVGKDRVPVWSEANARLIAAAPNLYEALAHLVWFIEPIEHEGRIPGLATLNAARAALDKARGES